MFNTNVKYILFSQPCYVFVLFLQQNLVGFCFGDVVCLFFFILFDDLDLELRIPLFNLGLGNLVNLVVLCLL
jgi:hypothetical protein